MAQTEFVGTTYTVVHGAFTLEGILDVKIVQTGGPEPEGLDITRFGHTAYTYMADPLGTKGTASVTLTVVCQDSTQSVDDSTMTGIPFNTPASTVVAFQPGTANANEWTHATLELTKRVTEIPFKGNEIAKVTLTFEANGAGTWDSPV